MKLLYLLDFEDLDEGFFLILCETDFAPVAEDDAYSGLRVTILPRLVTLTLGISLSNFENLVYP